MENNTTFATSRSKYIDKINEIPNPVVKQRILNNQDQLNDSEIYSVVALGAAATSIIDLFTPDGAKVVGLRNISNQKLDAEKYFMVNAIEILYGIDAADSGYSATFATCPIPDAVFNGELEITQNGRKIFSKQSMGAFFTGITASSIAVGPLTALANGKAIIKLDNPKFLYPQEEIKARMEWGHHCGAANSYLKIRLIGTVNERA